MSSRRNASTLGAGRGPVDEIPLSLWRSLYIAADDLRQLAPWGFMTEDQLFGVQNPVNREVGYCSLMGHKGEFFALAVYLGSDGLAAYEYLVTTRDPPSLARIFGRQRALMLSFEGREQQLKEDLAVIKALGLRYRGAQAWPLFRSSRPNHLPWLLERAEAEFLLTVLSQALEVAPRQLLNPSLVPPVTVGQKRPYFTRLPKDSANWEDGFTTPAPLPPTVVKPEVDSALLAKAKARVASMTVSTARVGVWQVDYMLTDVTIAEPGQRPFLGGAVLVADAESGLVLATSIGHPDSRPRSLSTSVLEQLLTAPRWPQRLEVRDSETAALLAPIAAALQLPVVLQPRLKAAEEAMVALNEHVAYGL